MKKKILFIGNTDGLPGVKVDAANYKKFFQSQYGGGWLDYEIEIKLNPSLMELSIALSRIKKANLDYAIVIFSGHGGQSRETILELNSNGDLIPESSLKGLATRQLNIFDCCRAYPERTVEIQLNERFNKAFSATTSTREDYENRIMQAIPQQVSLYACSIGECSMDTAEGGAYTKNLLYAASQITSSYKLVGTAHEEATIVTNRQYKEQNPEAILPRCLSAQQLIIGIKPSTLRFL